MRHTLPRTARTEHRVCKLILPSAFLSITYHIRASLCGGVGYALQAFQRIVPTKESFLSVILSIRPLVFVAICIGVQYNADYDEAGHAFQAEAGPFFDPKPAGVPALIPSCGVGRMVFCFGFWVKWIVRACGVCICSRRRVRSILYVKCHPGVSPPKLEQDHDGFNPGVVVLKLCRAQ